jgi:phosphoglycerol transferase MdoB-like AlkP superfamily enzyme
MGNGATGCIHTSLLIEYLKRKSPKVVFLSYGETDDFAHDGKYDAYLRSARQTDSFIEDLWKWVQGNPAYRDKTTFVITTDHGRGTVPLDAWKNHANDIPGADEIWIAVLGPDTPPLGEVKTKTQLFQKQIAKTAAVFFGVQYN